MQSTATDIFSLGCVFYYVIFEGAHPFGDDQISILANIRDCKPQIDLRNRTARQAEVVNLVLNMISGRPRSRPSASAILKHHTFWPKKIALQFLIDVSNVADQPLKGSLVAVCCESVQTNKTLGFYCGPQNSSGWKRFLCPSVQSYSNGNERRRKGYNGESMMELIRVIRNMHLHYWNLNGDLKKALGAPPERFLDYWTLRFPLLIDTVWLVFEKLKGDDGAALGDYYFKNYNFSYSGDGPNMLSAFVEHFCKQHLAK